MFGVRLAGTLGAAIIVLTLPGRTAAAVPVPPAQEILQRMLTTIAALPEVVSADAELRLRIVKSPTAPPDCVFRGTVKVTGGHPTVRIGGHTFGLLCWAVDRFVIGRQFEGSEPLERFLARFTFEVLGEKLVGNGRYYLLQGKARDSGNDPSAMIGWIDFDRGLLVDGTVMYSWGRIDTAQSYTQMGRMWMPTYQILHAPRFDASMEIVYSNFQFDSR
ncbi:MAG TPA: hypothetical protein VK881_01440 [bacterium]|nr:hypothetical protein [bacterium]